MDKEKINNASALLYYGAVTQNVEEREALPDSHIRERAKYGHEFRGAQNQESLYWRRPAAIYSTGPRMFVD